MLTQVAESVLVHTSGFMQSNAVVVQGAAGVLLIDAGVLDSEMACLADDLRGAGPARCRWLLDASALGPRALASPARLGAPVRDGPLRVHGPNGLSDPGAKDRLATLELVPAGHCRPRTAGAARPHQRPAPRNSSRSMGWPTDPDHPAPGSRPGPCGAVDRGTQRARRGRHAV